MVKTIKAAALSGGLLLVGLNIAGFFIPLRHPDLSKEPRRYKGTTLTEAQLRALSNRQQESIESYVSRLNNLVWQSTVHYWRDEGIDKYHIRVPFYENYLLFIASYLKPAEYRKYEFCNYRKAIDRGVALCSQRATILSQILARNGVDSRIVELKGHVVVTVQVDKKNDTWWIADPDYGVVIDHDIATIHKDSEIIKPYYSARGYDAETISNLTGIYATSHRIYQGVKDYRNRKVYYFEYLSYLLIWIIPIALICASSSKFFSRLLRGYVGIIPRTTKDFLLRNLAKRFGLVPLCTAIVHE